MQNIHHQRLFDNIAQLMDSGKHTDLTIECDGRQFKVHRAMVCLASSTLAVETEAGVTESLTGVVKHTNFDADTVQRIIDYIYKTTYQLAEDLKVTIELKGESGEADREAAKVAEIVTLTGTSARLIAHVRMYAIGEYYHLSTLKILAKENFTNSIDPVSFETAGFIHVIRQVKEHIGVNGDEIRDALHTIALSNISKLTKDVDLMKQLTELDDVQDFAADMLRQMVRHQILDKEAHAQQLAKKDQEIHVKNVEVQRLRRECEEEIRRASERADGYERSSQRIQEVMDRLVEDLEGLPSECRNSKCDRTFGDLSIERKGRSGEGNWEMRCARCRCRLCSK